MSEAVAETVATEEVVAPETTSQEAEEVQTTEETAVEDRTYAGKYKSADDLEKGYQEMQSLYNSRYKGFTGAPEEGEYEVKAVDGIEQADLDHIKDTPMFQKLAERGIEQGMNNELFNGIINDYISIQREETQIYVDSEKQKLGENAEQRIENLVGKLGTKYDGDTLEAVKASLTTAAVVEAWEMMLDEQTNTVAPKDVEVQSADKEAELNKLWVAVDDNGRRKMEYDASYRAMVNKKFKDFYGE